MACKGSLQPPPPSRPIISLYNVGEHRPHAIIPQPIRRNYSTTVPVEYLVENRGVQQLQITNHIYTDYLPSLEAF